MKKHSLAIVFSLIVLLSLVGAVSASEDAGQADDAPVSLNQEEVSMQTADVEIVEENYECSVSPSIDDSLSDEELGSAISERESSDFSRASAISVSGDGGLLKEDCNGNSYDSCEARQISLASCHDVCEERLDVNLDVLSAIPDCDVQSLEIVDLENNDDYKLGHDVTTACCELLDFNSADDILVIATTELAKINDLTIVNVLNGIVNASNGYVTFDKDNLLLLSSITIDSTDIAFFVKKAESIEMAFFENEELISHYSGDACSDLSAGLWSELQYLLNHDDIENLVFIVDSWANGLLSDDASLDLNELDSTGLTCGQAMISLLNCYPPTNKFDLPLGDTSADVLGVPRDSDDDAFIWTMHSNPGENAFIGVDMVNKSITGSLNLNLKSATSETQVVKAADALTANDLKKIGVDASKKALSYFKSQGIDIQKDYPYLYVLTSAGYVKINGLSTDSVLDGITEVLGSKLGKTLLPIHTPLWKDLVFYFLWVNSTNNKDYLSYGLEYDIATSKLVASKAVKSQGDELAYDMGLYKKESSHHYPSNHHSNGHAGSHASAGWPLNVTAQNNTAAVNRTSNNVTALNSTNNTNATVSAKKFDSVSQPKAKIGSQYNILYTIAAIILIFVIFRVGNSKRFD